MSKLEGIHSSRAIGGSHSPMFQVPVQMLIVLERGERETNESVSVVSFLSCHDAIQDVFPKPLQTQLVVSLQVVGLDSHRVRPLQRVSSVESPEVPESRNPPRPNNKSRLLSLQESTVNSDSERNGDVVLDRGKPGNKVHVQNTLEDERAIFDRRVDAESSLHLQIAIN